MSQTITLSLSLFVSSGNTCAPDQFKAEILEAQQEARITKVLLGDPNVDFENVHLRFAAVPDAGEIAVLEELAAAHTGEGLPGAAVTPEGFPIVAPTWERTNLDPIWKGFLYQATAKQNAEDPAVYSMFDEPITRELLLRGGWYAIMSDGASSGDFIEFSIVDKDDILGMFGPSNLTVGNDVLELAKFVRTEYVSPTSNNIGVEHNFTTRGGFRLVPGLYMRTHYVSTGTTAPQFKVRLEYQE